MTKHENEPEYIEKVESKDEKTVEKIKELLDSQSFAVLATHDGEQIHTTLITFAVSEDYKKLVFATPVETRKFEHLVKCKTVSLLIDNRSKFPGDLNKIAALTVSGNSKLLKKPQNIKNYRDILTKRHPYLKGFASAPSTAIIEVSNLKYLYVSKFQETFEWTP